MTEPTGTRPASQNALRSARRLLQAKCRRETGRFLAEGPQAVREALAADRVVEVFATDRALARYPELTAGAARVDEAQLAQLTDAVTPQGLVAVCTAVDVPLGTALAGRPSLVVVCADVRDPGNAGTVIRCADAAGADAVVLTAGSVDLHNPKTVRASVGSLFHLPIAVGADLADVLDRCRAAGLVVRAAAGDGADDLTALDRSGALARPTCWVFGNEAHGLSAEQQALADQRVAVPIYGRAESLNLATAAAVCLYASAFARRRADDRG